MTRRISRAIVAVAAALTLARGSLAADRIKALLVDGQNNHDWKACQPVLKWILEDAGRFAVDVASSPPAAPKAPAAPKGNATPAQKAAYEKAVAAWKTKAAETKASSAEQWKAWRPAFGRYGVVVLNYTGEEWPEAVRADFEKYVAGGGGVVVVHAADNAFGRWAAYNEMIGLGGWGGRNEASGPMLRWRDGKVVRDESPGPGGTHGAQHEFVVETRAPDHPIMKGLPPRWKHASDELYAKLRGPAKNLTVLATAFSAPETRGTGEHEPILFTVAYGQGRIFHTVIGHGPAAMSGRGFQVTLQRGAEWAATGAVTLPPPPPEDLPADRVVTRPPPP